MVYDPHAQMFICWNKRFKNLVARRNPMNLSNCKFRETVSVKRPNGVKSRYTTTYQKGNTIKEVEMRFNRNGNSTSPGFIRGCLARTKKSKERAVPRIDIDVDYIMRVNQNVFNIRERNIGSELDAYNKLTSYCAEPDVVVSQVSSECGLVQAKFCKHMKRIHQRHTHGIAPELQNICQNEWKNN